MRLHCVILFLYSTTFLNVVAQNELLDSTYIKHELNEVVITASDNRLIGNKTFFYPSKELKDVTSNGVQLLAGLQIPDLIINPATGSVEKLGGGDLSIRINGRPASQIDIFISERYYQSGIYIVAGREIR